MGFGGISVWQLLIILLIVIMLVGTKRLKGLGSDLGDAIKGFRKSVGADEEKASEEQKHNQQVPNQQAQQGTVINGEARKVEDPVKKD